MFSSLSVKNFRIYWAGMFISLVGTWIQQTAQSWLVFKLSNSSLLLGMVGFLGSLPMLLFSLFGGVLADRADKRKSLIITQVLFMGLALWLAVLTQAKIVTVLEIMVIALLNGTIMAFDAPLRLTVVVDLVGKAHLYNAIALNSLSFNSSRVIGPALAGILIAAIGMSGCFYINALSFLAVIGALIFIRYPEKKRLVPGHPLKELIAGLVLVWKNPMMLAMIYIVGLVSLFGVSYVILMPVFAQDVLHSGVRGLAGLISATGVGAVLGALILARLGEFKYQGRLLMWLAFIFSLSLTAFAFTKVFWGARFALTVVGGSSVMAVALINTLLQYNVSDDYRGRVMSVFTLVFAGIMPFGNLLAGVVANRFGVVSALMFSGIACTLALIWICFAFPRIRRL